MDVQELKETIIVDNKIIHILSELGMHHIKLHGNGKYYSCGMPDGDNIQSTIVYTKNLNIEAYTRNITDVYGNSDIISLVSFIRKTYFSESIKWICEICEYDYYSDSINESKLAKWVRKIYKTSIEKDIEDEQLKPLNENVLRYFDKYTNKLFYKDNINYHTQEQFELGYDLMTHSITIPIRDELGTLVGVKGRIFKEQLTEEEKAFKYFYIFPCAKSQILYGLYKTMPYIKQSGEVIVAESEKGVLQLWSMGYKNSVAIGGHQLSKCQIQKLTHLGVEITIAYDQGVEIDNIGKIDKNFYKSEFDKFLPQQKINCIYDKNGKILNLKESPMDNPNKWEELYAKKLKIR